MAKRAAMAVAICVTLFVTLSGLGMQSRFVQDAAYRLLGSRETQQLQLHLEVELPLQAVPEGGAAPVLPEPGEAAAQQDTQANLLSANAEKAAAAERTPKRRRRRTPPKAAGQVQQQQQSVAAAPPPTTPPESAYVAFCIAVKDEHVGIREWLLYHQSIGVGRFYIYDTQSSPPMRRVLQPFIASGLVRYFPNPNLQSPYFPPRFKQMVLYERCLRQWGKAHQWMGFVDADEFVVLRNRTPSLPALLRGYTQYGGLALHWIMFGSSGHVDRPVEEGVMASYTSCLPLNHRENRHVKTIVNTRYGFMPLTPHNFAYHHGKWAVNTKRQRLDGPKGVKAVHALAVVHHYAVKSQQDYTRKMARGSGMSNVKGLAFWRLVEDAATDNCTQAVERGQRVMELARQLESAEGSGIQTAVWQRANQTDAKLLKQLQLIREGRLRRLLAIFGL